jgi:hypothetical protein
LRMCLPMYISVTSSLFSSSTGPPLGVKPVFSLQLDGRFWNPSLRGYPPSPCVLPATLLRLLSNQAAVTLLLLFIQGVEHSRTSVAFPHCPFIAHGIWSSWMHHGHAWHRGAGWTHQWHWRQIPKLLVGNTPSLTLPTRWRGALPMSSAGCTSWVGFFLPVLLQCPAWWSSWMFLYQ